MAILLKPHVGGGSVEHFYHFVCDYLLPLYEMEITTGIAGKGYVVRDCGPMNVWLDFVFGPDAFTKVPRETFQQERYGRSWDKHFAVERFAYRLGVEVDVARFRAVVSAFCAEFLPPIPRPGVVTVIDRRPPPPFYVDGRAELAGGGSTRRSISNLELLCQAISAHSPVTLVDFDGMSPADQLNTINATDVLIGQHGAGLTHLLFLRDNATLVEFNTTNPKLRWFQTLSAGAGRQHHKFVIDGLHTELSPELIAEISEFIARRG